MTDHDKQVLMDRIAALTLLVESLRNEVQELRDIFRNCACFGTKDGEWGL